MKEARSLILSKACIFFGFTILVFCFLLARRDFFFETRSSTDSEIRCCEFLTFVFEYTKRRAGTSRLWRVEKKETSHFGRSDLHQISFSKRYAVTMRFQM